MYLQYIPLSIQFWEDLVAHLYSQAWLGISQCPANENRIWKHFIDWDEAAGLQHF